MLFCCCLQTWRVCRGNSFAGTWPCLLVQCRMLSSFLFVSAGLSSTIYNPMIILLSSFVFVCFHPSQRSGCSHLWHKTSDHQNRPLPGSQLWTGTLRRPRPDQQVELPFICHYMRPQSVRFGWKCCKFRIQALRFVLAHFHSYWKTTSTSLCSAGTGNISVVTWILSRLTLTFCWCFMPS